MEILTGRPVLGELLDGINSKIEDLAPLSKEDFEERHEKARVIMSKCGVDVLYLSGSTNLLYYSGVKVPAHDRLFAMFLPKEGQPFLICPGIEKESVLERIKYGHDEIFTWEEYEDPYSLTAKILKDKGLATATIGVDENMPFWYYNKLANALPSAKYRDADVVTHYQRAIKTEKEIAFIRRASEISLDVHQMALSGIYPGMKEAELNEFYHRAHEKMGAQKPWGGGSFGPASSYIHGTIQKFTLEDGMVILADSGASVHGYTSDISRTVVCGTPDERTLRAWEVAKKCQTAGIEAIHPGAACEDVDLSIRRVLEEEGYSPTYKYLPHRVGHGIGLDIHEPPFLVEGNKTLMEAGMVFAFDGAFYIEGEFGIRLEDNYLVTEDGCEIFGDRLATAIDKPFG